jgi:uncharacterized membrane protein
MANSKFSIQESLNYGWNAFKSQTGFFLGFILIFFIISFVPSFIVQRLFPAPNPVGFVLRVVLWLVNLYLGMVSTRIALDIYDSGTANLNRLGDLFQIYIPYVIGKFLFAVMVGVGTILLIVPGIILSLMFLYVGYLVVDRRLGPIEALKESYRITTGVKWPLFVFGLVIVLVNIVGMVCLGIGLFVSVPITMMASAYVYRQLSPRAAGASVTA